MMANDTYTWLTSMIMMVNYYMISIMYVYKYIYILSKLWMVNHA